MIIKSGQRGVEREGERERNEEKVCVCVRERRSREKALLDVIMKDDSHTR